LNCPDLQVAGGMSHMLDRVQLTPDPSLNFVFVYAE